jgi:hypothetical protein
MRLTRQLGFQLLGVWLVAMGLFTVVPLTVPLLGGLLAVLAICAGLLILVGR